MTMPKRLPKWAKDAVDEEAIIELGTVDELVADLAELPDDAYLEVETEWGECYGHASITARWTRDMNEAEYHKTKALRAKLRRERAEAAEEAKAKRRKLYESLREEFSDE